MGAVENDRIFEESLNRAFGVVVNELRLLAIRERLNEVKRAVPIQRLASLAKNFAMGQGGSPSEFEESEVWRDADLVGVPAVEDVHPAKLRAAMDRLAGAWNAKVTGDDVLVTVAAPQRSSRQPTAESSPSASPVTSAQWPHGLVSRSRVMQALVEQLNKVAPTSAPILVRGETGTGKEMVARAIHGESQRPGPFISVSCSAIESTRVERSVFGNERGAFPGAAQPNIGAFENAKEGTLFLDEIADLNPVVQERLLRAIHDQRIHRVGGTDQIDIDHVRVVSSSAKDLVSIVAGGKFRPDLYSRLSIITLEIPPLRDRREDIPELVDMFLAEMNLDRTQLPANAMELFARYSWPGNVRELRNAVARSVATGNAELVLQTSSPQGWNPASSSTEGRGVRLRLPAPARADDTEEDDEA